MDFKSMVNKESFRAILHQHLKSQAQAKFGNSILKDIHKHYGNEVVLADNIIDSVASNVSQSEESKEFLKTFLNSLNSLFDDKEKYIPKEDNRGTISQCSSASSISTSIDYISFDQFQDIIHTLSNGVNAEKLEALETFSRLPSLEHIIKKTLWPSVESGLHNALLSKVSFLKDASLKVFTKMLSSSEPKVVQESFNSLIKHLLQNLLPSVNQNADDFIRKCKSTVEIIAVLNKFLQNIPNHWLRYPQPIIEDIAIQSVNILSFGSRSSNIFPIWLCIALCDKKSKWFKTLLFGHISRAFILDALQKDLVILEFTIQFCDKFNMNDNCLSWINNCCQRFAEISEITHIVCFLSYLLQYSQCREMFSAVHISEELFSWLSVLDLIMKCTQKLCLVSCVNCSCVVQDVVSKLWCNIWSTSHCDSLIKILLYFNDIEHLSVNGINFIILCLNNSFYSLNETDCSEEGSDRIVDFICALIRHLTNFPFDFSVDASPEVMKLFNSGLLFTNKILTNSSNLFINLKFLETFSSWFAKISNISKAVTSSFTSEMKNTPVKEIKQNISSTYISMLQKSYSILILQNLELFEASINVLLENILEAIKIKNSVCLKNMCMLSNALDCNYSSKPVLTKSITFKLSSVLWQMETGELENLPKVRNILEILMPSIFPDIFENEIFLDLNCDNEKKLFHCLILYPSVTKPEFVMVEEYHMLALQVMSSLTSSVLSSCYLQAKYKIADMFFEFQSQHFTENDIPIIDPLSVMQNHLLVKLFTIGGSDERVLPPETLLKNDDEYSWPFFKSYPVPDVYYQELSVVGAADLDITFELNAENLKDVFLEYVEDEILSIDVIAQILKASINILEPASSLTRILNFVCLEDVNHITLPDEIVCGLDMVKRYGKILNLTASEDEAMIERILKAGKSLLSSENRFQLDVFICTLCLIFRCDIQTSWLFLETFAKSSSSLFIWYERIVQAIEQNEKHTTAFNAILEHCDIIVKKVLPLVYSALQFSGILPSTLFKYWTTLCYWNYLNFTEISQFILVTVIFGGDYAIYFFVSVLKHMESTILKNAHSSNLINVIKQNPITGYKIQNFTSFIIELSDMFHCKISESISNIFEE